MKLYAGIDLHSTNSFIGVVDDNGKRLFGKRVPNREEKILLVLDRFKKDLAGIVVESTYNWYWLVDALQAEGYRVHLANPAGNVQYSGLKYTDDETDAYWLGDLKRLGILKEGYIYPKELRPTRDLLRRRLMFVRQRTAHILSLQSLMTRQLSLKLTGSEIKRLGEGELRTLFGDGDYFTLAKCNIRTIRYLDQVVGDIEATVKEKVKLHPNFERTATIPGIGNILGLTTVLEIGEIERFSKAGNYSSYCRSVASKRTSNGKRKGTGNRKNGSRYLAWAYVEAANFAIRYCREAQRFYQRKKSKTNNTVALKASGNKLARATYHIVRYRVPFDAEKLFCR